MMINADLSQRSNQLAFDIFQGVLIWGKQFLQDGHFKLLGFHV